MARFTKSGSILSHGVIAGPAVIGKEELDQAARQFAAGTEDRFNPGKGGHGVHLKGRNRRRFLGYRDDREGEYNRSKRGPQPTVADRSASMKAITHGFVRGRTIELSAETGLPEGQEVTVTLEAVSSKLPPGEGIRRSAGAWANEAADLDAFLEWNRQQRKQARPELEP
jgi:hypothetical protein